MMNNVHISTFFTLLLLLGVGSPTAYAQLLERYEELYPTWPFSVAQADAANYSKCSVWKTVYRQTAGDVSGEPWMQDTIPGYRSDRFDFFGGKPRVSTSYTPDNNKIQSMEYFYQNGVAAAIEVKAYDSLNQDGWVDYVIKYSYHYLDTNGQPSRASLGEAFQRKLGEEEDRSDQAVPAQRIREYVTRFRGVRLLDEFDFDTLYHLRRLKTTVVGYAPQMETKLGWKADEKRLLTINYTDTSRSLKVMRDMRLILEDRHTLLDEAGRPYKALVRNAQGEHLFTIDYAYDEEGRLIKKTHWVRPFVPKVQTPEPEEPSKKAKRKQKKAPQSDVAPTEEVAVVSPRATPVQAPALPVVYKVEYFTYTPEGLVERYISEEKGLQTVLEYSYFNE